MKKRSVFRQLIIICGNGLIEVGKRLLLIICVFGMICALAEECERVGMLRACNISPPPQLIRGIGSIVLYPITLISYLLLILLAFVFVVLIICVLDALRCGIYRFYWHIISGAQLPYSIEGCRVDGIETLDDYIFMMYCLSGFITKGLSNEITRFWAPRKGVSFKWSSREMRRASKLFPDQSGIDYRTLYDRVLSNCRMKFSSDCAREPFALQVSDKIRARGEEIMRERGTLLIPEP